ncbi:MAG: hypothetical protein ACO1N9_03260 [Flavobacterium sp.]
MRNVLLIFFVLFMAQAASAQFDSPLKGTAIPKAKKKPKKKDPPKPEAPRVFSITPPKENSPVYQIGSNKQEFSMMQQDKFVSRSAEYQDRVTYKPRGESNEPYKGNQYFGEFRTKSLYIKVLARDFGAQDGDRIKVLVNDVTQIENIMLENQFQSIQITLQPGFNKVDFEALNQGYSGPNTAEFQVYDDKGDLLSANEWNLATGFKATFMFVKE